MPTQFSKTSIKDNKLNDSQVREMQATVGPQVYSAWQSIIADPRYQALTDADKATALKRANDAISAAGKAQFGAKNNIIPQAGYKLNSSAQGVVTGNQQDYLSSVLSNQSISTKLDQPSRVTLAKFGAMSTTDRTKAFNSQPSAEYQYNLAKYNNDKANGALTQAQDIKTQAALAKEQVGSQFNKNVRDLYSLSKTQIYDFVTTDSNGSKIASDLQAYDKALVDAGIIAKGKFAGGVGSSKGGRAKSSKASKSVSRASYMKSFKSSQVKVPKTPSAPHIKVSSTSVPKFKAVSLKQYRINKNGIAHLGRTKIA